MHIKVQEKVKIKKIKNQVEILKNQKEENLDIIKVEMKVEIQHQKIKLFRNQMQVHLKNEKVKFQRIQMNFLLFCSI